DTTYRVMSTLVRKKCQFHFSTRRPRPPPPPVHIHSLPNRCLLIIFRNFSLQNRKQLAHVCRRWKAVLSSVFTVCQSSTTAKSFQLPYLGPSRQLAYRR